MSAKVLQSIRVAALAAAFVLFGLGPSSGVPLLGGGARPALAATTLKAQFFLPKGHPISKRLEAIYGEIEQATGGEIKIQSFYASELVPLRQALDGLAGGTLDLLVGPGNYYSGKIAIADFGIMPLNFRAYGDRSKAYYDKGMGDILDKVYGKIGVTVQAPFNYFTGEEVLVSKKVTVEKFEDLKGLKLRVAGGELIEMVKAMGAQPAFIAPPEMYTALQRGTVDGAIFPAHDLSLLKLSEVVGSVVGPDWLFSGPMMHLFKFNKRSWESLSPAVRAKVRDALQAAALRDDANAERELTALYRGAADQAGVRFITLPAPEVAKARVASVVGREAYLKYNEEQGHRDEARQVLSILDGLSGL
jgi:TRAP-type C4-dicarboxylate transport system substrate-binding protein